VTTLFDDASKMFGITGDEGFSARIDDEIQLFQNQHANQDAVSIGFDDRPKSLSENRPRRGGQSPFVSTTPQKGTIPDGSRIGSKCALPARNFQRNGSWVYALGMSIADGCVAATRLGELDRIISGGCASLYPRLFTVRRYAAASDAGAGMQSRSDDLCIAGGGAQRNPRPAPPTRAAAERRHNLLRQIPFVKRDAMSGQQPAVLV
jgi:hypothetical protein